MCSNSIVTSNPVKTRDIVLLVSQILHQMTENAGSFSLLQIPLCSYLVKDTKEFI